MLRPRLLAGSFATLLLFNGSAQELIISDDNPLAMPPVGAHQLRIVSPDLIELTLITTQKPDPASLTVWNFIGENAQGRLPGEKEFSVLVDVDVPSIRHCHILPGFLQSSHL